MPSGETPPFYRIPPLVFQQLCRELLAREPEITTWGFLQDPSCAL
jgi:hypothetical protein